MSDQQPPHGQPGPQPPQQPPAGGGPYGTQQNPYGAPPPTGPGGYPAYPGSPPPAKGGGAGKVIAVVAAVVVGLIVVVAVVAVLVASLGGSGVEELADGDCVTAEGLSDSEAEEVTGIEVVECDEPHDGEVLATKELSGTEADEYDPGSAGADHCAELVGGALPEGIRGTALTQKPEPDEDDLLVCIVFDENGDELTGKVELED